MATAICIGCGCDEHHACEHGGTGCWWLRYQANPPAGVCSRCEDLVVAWDAGARTPNLGSIADRFHRQVMFLYDEESSARAWMQATHQQLGRSPADAILDGELDDVRAIIDQLQSGAYI